MKNYGLPPAYISLKPPKKLNAIDYGQSLGCFAAGFLLAGFGIYGLIDVTIEGTWATDWQVVAFCLGLGSILLVAGWITFPRS